jgi:hypothetical protein
VTTRTGSTRQPASRTRLRVAVPTKAPVPKVHNPVPTKTNKSLLVTTPFGPVGLDLAQAGHGNPTFCRLPVIDCG